MARLSEKLQGLRVGPELHMPRRKSDRKTAETATKPEAVAETPKPKRAKRSRPVRKPRRPGGGSPRRVGPEVKLPKLSRGASGDGLVGLEIEADSIAAAEVRGGGTQLAKSAIAPLPEGAFADGEVVDPAAIATALRNLFAEHKLSKRVRIGVANQRVVVRTMRMPAIDDPEQLSAAVRFQAEEQLPMPVDQAILDHRVVGGSPAGEDGEGPTIDVVVSAARREMIFRTLEPIRAAGLEPVGIDLSAFGMIRALGAPVSDDEATVLYCNVADTTNLAIATGRTCVFTRVSPAGLESIAAKLVERTGLSPDHARMWLKHVGLGDPVDSIEGDPEVVAATRDVVQSGASALLDELRISIDYYGAQEGTNPVERVVLGGPGSDIRGLAEQLGPNLALPVEIGRPAALAALDSTAAARLTLPYGLALEE